MGESRGSGIPFQPQKLSLVSFESSIHGTDQAPKTWLLLLKQFLDNLGFSSVQD